MNKMKGNKFTLIILNTVNFIYIFIIQKFQVSQPEEQYNVPSYIHKYINVDFIYLTAKFPI